MELVTIKIGFFLKVYIYSYDLNTQYNILYNIIVFLFSGRATRCPGDRLCVPGHGHGRRCRGGVERSAVFGTQELQGPRGQDPASVRKSHAATASQHR